ncbi:MAG: hypothetical protein DRP02_06910 [Candidatus Gerdarchaeota archaeon]|nr:MAG: hypothetical protein DRP02_06910 [Candidatus Gerdarchaeota archaeon]
MNSEKTPLTIIRVSRKRFLQELALLTILFLFSLFLIVYGLAERQTLFFQLLLSLLGFGLFILFLESIISLISLRIEISQKQLKVRKYFIWRTFLWSDISSIEIIKRTAKLLRKKPVVKIHSVIIHYAAAFDFILPFTRFSKQKADEILSLILSYLKKPHGKNGSTSEEQFTQASKPLSEEEIAAQIPPKVQDFELE